MGLYRRQVHLPRCKGHNDQVGHNGHLRVDGRLKNSSSDFNGRHPIILPKDDKRMRAKYLLVLRSNS